MPTIIHPREELIRVQGFTADIFCEYWDPKDTTVPPILVGNTAVKDWNNSENLIDNIVLSELHSDYQVDDKGIYTVPTM